MAVEITRLRQEIALRPIRVPTRSIVPSESHLYMVVGGNILPSGQTVGVARRTDAVAGSEMPAGTGGSSGDTLIQPAYPFPAGLPLGVGVGQHVFTLAYAFLLIDNHTTFASDLPLGRRAFTGTTVNLDKIVGGVTYRYPCYLVISGN